MASTAERLKEGLSIRGMKQADLVSATGIGKSSISTYLTGEYEPKQRNIYKMAKALNVSEAWLMGADVAMTRPTDDSLVRFADQQRGHLAIGRCIEIRRKQLGLTQSELARQIKVKNTTVSNWENNVSKPDPDTIENLCWALDVSPNYFFNHVETSLRTAEIPTAKNIMPLPKTYQVPLVGSIACGKPIVCIEEAEEAVEVPESIHADFALRCKGDSMINSRIFDGDVVYVRAQPEVENGEIAAVRIDDEATLKKVYLYGDRVVLRAANPMYDDMVYAGDELGQVEILGLAVAFLSRIK